MKISRKLANGFSIIILLIILVAVAAAYGFNTIVTRIEAIHSSSIPLLVSTNAQSGASLEAHNLLKDFLYADTVAKRNKYRAETLQMTSVITRLVEEELTTLQQQPPSAQITSHITQDREILQSVQEYEKNIQVLADELNQKNVLEDTLSATLNKINDIIAMFIDDKTYANNDTTMILDALKEIWIAQLKIRLLLNSGITPSAKAPDSAKITALDNTIMEQMDRLLNLVSDREQIKTTTYLIENIKEYIILAKRILSGGTGKSTSSDQISKRIAARKSLLKEQQAIDTATTSLIAEYTSRKDSNTQIINKLNTLKGDIPRIEKMVDKYLNTEDEKIHKRIGKIITSLLKTADSLKHICCINIDSSTSDTLIKSIKTYGTDLETWLALKLKIEHVTYEKLDAITASVRNLLVKKVDNVEKATGVVIDEMHSSAETSLTIVLGATLIAIVFGVLTSIILIINITRPINSMTLRLENLSSAQNQLVSFMEGKLAQSDWSEYCQVDISEEELNILATLGRRQDEIGVMSREGAIMSKGFSKCIEATNAVIKQVNFVLNKVSSTVEEVARNSSHLEGQSTELANGATRQAANLQQISSALQDMSVKVDQNAKDSTQARDLSSESNTSGNSGTKKMNRLVEKMQQINDATSEITRIIKTIDDIAFQTNLLALNAAVEAARAGSHGKGFSVVAQEVRNLAARSAKAAGETGELIDNVVREINSGNEMVGNTAEVLSEIVSFSQQVTTLSNEVAAASTDQASGITQINTSLTEVNDITQHNAANAEETASSSQILSHHAHTLQQLSENFILMEDENDYDEDEYEDNNDLEDAPEDGYSLEYSPQDQSEELDATSLPPRAPQHT